MEYELEVFVHTVMVLVVDSSCFPSRFNVVELLRSLRVDELLLKEFSECGLALDCCQYYGISGSVLAQHFYTTACHFIRNTLVGVGNDMTEEAANHQIWHHCVLL